MEIVFTSETNALRGGESLATGGLSGMTVDVTYRAARVMVLRAVTVRAADREGLKLFGPGQGPMRAAPPPIPWEWIERVRVYGSEREGRDAAMADGLPVCVRCGQIVSTVPVMAFLPGPKVAPDGIVFCLECGGNQRNVLGPDEIEALNLCVITGKVDCVERSCELHWQDGPLKLDEPCSQCGPGHDRGDGHCERHGKRVAS